VTKLPDGGWLFRWTGTELKVAMRKGHPNEYTYRLDEDLRPRFEEYLQVWRPLLAAPDERHLWLGARGQPFTTGALRNQVVYTTQRFGGQGINPHLIRDIFASELLANGASIHDVARALGDVMKTVYDKYAHILEHEADTALSQISLARDFWYDPPLLTRASRSKVSRPQNSL
jgi:site-specific recombinase XerD